MLKYNQCGAVETIGGAVTLFDLVTSCATMGPKHHSKPSLIHTFNVEKTNNLNGNKRFAPQTAHLCCPISIFRSASQEDF